MMFGDLHKMGRKLGVKIGLMSEVKEVIEQRL